MSSPWLQRKTTEMLLKGRWPHNYISAKNYKTTKESPAPLHPQEKSRRKLPKKMAFQRCQKKTQSLTTTKCNMFENKKNFALRQFVSKALHKKMLKTKNEFLLRPIKVEESFGETKNDVGESTKQEKQKKKLCSFKKIGHKLKNSYFFRR